jgi:hypothetical protein
MLDARFSPPPEFMENVELISRAIEASTRPAANSMALKIDASPQ